ncbi:hypothetical protein PG993_010791 [Apiospora rasikravindrae]|uniref:Uncharacterized protein n=1 Tax=Apiospora rasikravindrae TaxID=990691 RepID=A0ABR1SCG2_9PEZI
MNLRRRLCPLQAYHRQRRRPLPEDRRSTSPWRKGSRAPKSEATYPSAPPVASASSQTAPRYLPTPNPKSATIATTKTWTTGPITAVRTIVNRSHLLRPPPNPTLIDA